MSFPHVFGTLPAGNNPASYFDDNFAYTLGMGGGSFLSSVTGTNTIAGILSPTPSAYAAGQIVGFLPANTNTGATTLNINSLGAKNVFNNGAACTGGELIAGRPAVVCYDGTQFNLMNPQFPVGTWTPVIAGSVTPGTQTYAIQSGTWTKLGRMVFGNCRVSTSAIDGTTAGAVTVTGLPYTSLALANNLSGVAMAVYNSINLSAGYSQLGGYIDQGSSRVIIVENGDNVASQAVVAAALGATTVLAFSFSYPAAA